MKQTCILIPGMHRSGTSAFAGLLSHLGVSLGSDLMPPTEDNPKGYFENNRLFLLNENYLRQLGSSWDDFFFNCETPLGGLNLEPLKEALTEEFGASKLFAIKDPRLAYLFPLYEQVLTDMDIEIKVAIPYRHPYEVAKSLQKRDCFHLEKSYLLWANHIYCAEQFSRPHGRYLFCYDQLLENSLQVVEQLSSRLNLDFGKEYEQNQQVINQFLLPSLKRQKVANSEYTDHLPQIIRKFFFELENTAVTQDYQSLQKTTKKFFSDRALFLNDHIQETLVKNAENLHLKIDKAQLPIGSFQYYWAPERDQFDEQHSHNITLFERQIQIPLTFDTSNSSYLRIDALDRGCVVKNIHLKCYSSSDELYESLIEHHNADIEKDGQYLFLHDDPIMIFPLPDAFFLERVEFSAEIILNTSELLTHLAQELLPQNPVSHEAPMFFPLLRKSHKWLLAENQGLEQKYKSEKSLTAEVSMQLQDFQNTCATEFSQFSQVLSAQSHKNEALETSLRNELQEALSQAATATQQIITLHTQLADAKNQGSDTAAQLSSKLDQSRQRLAAAEREITLLKEESECSGQSRADIEKQLRTELITAIEQKSAADKEIALLKEQSKISRKNNTDNKALFKAELHTLTEQKSAADKEVFLLKKQLAQLDKACADKEAQLRTELSAAIEEKSAADTAITLLKEQLSEAQQSSCETEAQLRSKLSVAIEEKSAAGKEIALLKEQALHAHQKIAETETQLRNRFNSSVAEKSAADKEIALLKEQSGKAQKASADKITQLNTELNTAIEQRSAADKEIQMLAVQLQDQKKTYLASRDENQELASRNIELEKKLSELELLLTQKTASESNLQHQLQLSTEALTDSQKQHEQLRQSLSWKITTPLRLLDSKPSDPQDQ